LKKSEEAAGTLLKQRNRQLLLWYNAFDCEKMPGRLQFRKKYAKLKSIKIQKAVEIDVYSSGSCKNIHQYAGKWGKRWHSYGVEDLPNRQTSWHMPLTHPSPLIRDCCRRILPEAVHM
jgi:hypothetical protein